MGQLEVLAIMENIAALVQSRPIVLGIKKIYSKFPHVTWDNYFSGYKIIDWLGQFGFGAIMTCRRDLLPLFPGKYLHKKKTDTSEKKGCAVL